MKIDPDVKDEKLNVFGHQDKDPVNSTFDAV